MNIRGIFYSRIRLALILVPISIALALLNADPVYVFISTAIAIIAVARILGTATEELAKHAGVTLGVLMNVTFGNLIELMILYFALVAGLIQVVKAAITGSIAANLLLILGLSILLGGAKHKSLKFNIENASMNATMLTLAIITLAIPTAFSYQSLDPEKIRLSIEQISLASAVLLLIIYLCSILFSVYTHKELFGEKYKKETAIWSLPKALVALLTATILGAYLSKILVRSLIPFASAFNLTDAFMGVIVIAIIANATEHMVAVTAAMKNKVDISLGISAGSSSQIALFLAPILVFISFILGSPMGLVFTTMELVAIFASVLIYDILSTDGKFVWFEGIVFLGIYFLFGYAFLLIP